MLRKTLIAVAVLVALSCAPTPAQTNVLDVHDMQDGTYSVQVEGVIYAEMIWMTFTGTDVYGQPYTYGRWGVWFAHSDGGITLINNVAALDHFDPLDGVPTAANLYFSSQEEIHVANYTGADGNHFAILTPGGNNLASYQSIDAHVQSAEFFGMAFPVEEGGPNLPVFKTTYKGADGNVHTVTTECVNSKIKECAKQHKENVKIYQSVFPPAAFLKILLPPSAIRVEGQAA